MLVDVAHEITPMNDNECIRVKDKLRCPSRTFIIFSIRIENKTPEKEKSKPTSDHL